MSSNTTTELSFDQKYPCDTDSWGFTNGNYEKFRHVTTMEALPHRRFSRALEPGCSSGALSARLATVCDHVESVDISKTAIKLARERCHSLFNVNFTCASIANFIPAGLFDLLVFSEIGYYFEETTLSELAQRLVDRLAKNGTLIAVHWLGVSEDHVLSGHRVHEILSALPVLRHQRGELHPNFQLDRWRRI